MYSNSDVYQSVSQNRIRGIVEQTFLKYYETHQKREDAYPTLAGNKKLLFFEILHNFLTKIKAIYKLCEQLCLGICIIKKISHRKKSGGGK